MTNFEKHLFISYAHIDNQPLTPGQDGWVSRFHYSLKTVLDMRLGKEAEIWRDKKLQGNDVFSAEITNQLAKVAILVSVLTPRYLSSDWCIKEISEFCKTAEKNAGMVINNKARIFKVLKTPVDTQESLPDVVKDVLGYDFFTFDDDTPLELDSIYGEKYAQDYNRMVVKLAYEISELLKKLETESRTDTNDNDNQASVKATIYLAECSYDQKKNREILEGDLRCHGYTVLPDQQLPRDEAEYVEAVEKLLNQCKLSIHLVGDTYGGVPDGPSQKSIVVLQNELAVQKSKNSALSRVIWIPEGTQSKQPLQQAFIEALHQNAEIQYGADLITGDIEALKSSIHATLKKVEKLKSQLVDGKVAGSTKLIYLICNEKDRKSTIPVRKFLRDQGFEVSLPAFEGDAAWVRETHRMLLAKCDAIIIFYGAGDETWKRTLDNDIKKMPSYRSGKPLIACYTYLAIPNTVDKEDLIEMEESNLINGLSGFIETQIAAFVQLLKPHGES